MDRGLHLHWRGSRSLFLVRLMSTTLVTLEEQLSRYLGDWWQGIAETNTTNPTYTVKDTDLAGKHADWVSGPSAAITPSTVYIRTDAGALHGAPEDEERVVNVLTTASYIITTTTARPFGASVAAGDVYEIHRFCPRADKVDALKKACYEVFPDLHTVVSDERIRFGNWLVDGDVEDWSSSSALTYWTASGPTLIRTTTAGKVHSGTYSCGLSTTTGYVGQGITNNVDLMYLGGDTPILRGWVWASTASQMRLTIYDGTTTTNSDYHTGGSGWELLSVTAAIKANPDSVDFRAYYNSTASTAYIDDLSVTSVGGKRSYDLSDLGLRNNTPHQVHYIMGRGIGDTTPHPRGNTVRLHNWDTADGRLIFKSSLPSGAKLWILGMGYLTQPACVTYTGTHTPAGASATVLTDTTQSWATNELVGFTITNITDSSSGTCTSNTSNTATVDDLTGGSNDEFQQTNVYGMNSSTSVNVDAPAYMGIIYKAAKYLYSQKLHEGASQDIERYERMLAKCDYDYAQWRIGNAMPSIPATRL